jgi:hypothetical protein
MNPQPVRKSIAEICLWVAILAMAISVGGNLFQMSVIDPIWSASPPASVQAYFSDSRHMDALRSFHQNPFFFFGLFCLIGALILQWRNPTLRRWLLMAAVGELLIIAGTVLYVYPINDVLFVHAGSGLDSATAEALTRHWLLADRIRFVLKVAVFLCLLRTLSLTGRVEQDQPIGV